MDRRTRFHLYAKDGTAVSNVAHGHRVATYASRHQRAARSGAEKRLAKTRIYIRLLLKAVQGCTSSELTICLDAMHHLTVHENHRCRMHDLTGTSAVQKLPKSNSYSVLKSTIHTFT